MPIIHDSYGFAHETATGSLSVNRFVSPVFDISSASIPKELVALIENLLGEEKKNQKSLNGDDEQMIRPEWDEFTEPPGEVYIMIGNGFDIECGLPTSYMDFLNILSAVERLEKNNSASLNDLNLMADIQERLIKSFNSDPDYCNVWKPVISNYWYEHFSNVHIERGWVDFENEISRVIQTIEGSMDYVRFHRGSLDDNIGCYSYSDLHQVIGNILKRAEIIDQEELQNSTSYITYKLLYRELRDSLLEDLNGFIHGFEIYLREYVERLTVTPTANINLLMEKLKEADEKYVLSFNYTTTFERLLKKKGIDAEFCYIHGKIGNGTGKNKMVLGIDEHLGEEGLKKLIGFAPFRKYNQRIYKQTDSNYMDWLENIKFGKTLDRMLYIFGHSLGITDKDIIGSFIKSNDMRTVLFYHSEDAFSNQVSNLTAIIGMDELIHRTGGKTHTMEFQKQH